MAWLGSRLNVGLWNLSVGLAATGCGPLVPIDGDTDTDGPSDDDDDDDPSGETDPPNPTFPTTTTSPPDTDPFSCDPACPPDYFCVDGACIPDDECYYGSGGGYGYCCYDYCCDSGCYYECYYVEDCGAGEYCSTHDFACHEAEEIANCEPLATHFIPLPVEASGGAVALAFGDAQAGGGEELLVVSSGEARLVGGAGSTVTASVALPGAGVDASATTVAIPSGRGFAVSVPGAGGTQLVTLVGDSLVAGPVEATAPSRIVGGDFDGDDIGDVMGVEGETLVWLRGTGEGFAFGDHLIDAVSGTLARGRFDENDALSVAAHYSYGLPYYLRGLEGDFDFFPGRHAINMSLAAADFDGDGDDDLVGLTSSQGVMLVLPWENMGDHWVDAAQWSSDLGTDASGHYLVGVGDFDGDGLGDLFVGATTALRVLHGYGHDGFGCVSDIDLPHAATVIAVGDLDGNGRADVAFSDGTTTTVLTHQ